MAEAAKRWRRRVACRHAICAGKRTKPGRRDFADKRDALRHECTPHPECGGERHGCLLPAETHEGEKEVSHVLDGVIASPSMAQTVPNEIWSTTVDGVRGELLDRTFEEQTLEHAQLQYRQLQELNLLLQQQQQDQQQQQQEAQRLLNKIDHQSQDLRQDLENLVSQSPTAHRQVQEQLARLATAPVFQHSDTGGQHNALASVAEVDRRRRELPAARAFQQPLRPCPFEASSRAFLDAIHKLVPLAGVRKDLLLFLCSSDITHTVEREEESEWSQRLFLMGRSASTGENFEPRQKCQASGRILERLLPSALDRVHFLSLLRFHARRISGEVMQNTPAVVASFVLRVTQLELDNQPDNPMPSGSPNDCELPSNAIQPENVPGHPNRVCAIPQPHNPSQRVASSNSRFAYRGSERNMRGGEGVRIDNMEMNSAPLATNSAPIYSQSPSHSTLPAYAQTTTISSPAPSDHVYQSPGEVQISQVYRAESVRRSFSESVFTQLTASDLGLGTPDCESHEYWTAWLEHQLTEKN